MPVRKEVLVTCFHEDPIIRLFNNLDKGQVRSKLLLLPIGEGLYGLRICCLKSEDL